jgi:putative transposase
VTPDVARGIALRHDWGPQYASGHFQDALRWLGLEAFPVFTGEPRASGCAKRFIRTLREQCLWARTYVDLDDLRTAVRVFVERYNTLWLIERHGLRTPREAHAR